MPAEKGDSRANLTNTPGNNKERDPQWSPDAKHHQPLRRIRRDALHVSPQNGAGSVTKIELRPGFYRCRSNPPDSKRIALVDTFARLWYVDLGTKKQFEVAQDTYQMRNRRHSPAYVRPTASGLANTPRCCRTD